MTNAETARVCTVCGGFRGPSPTLQNSAAYAWAGAGEQGTRGKDGQGRRAGAKNQEAARGGQQAGAEGQNCTYLPVVSKWGGGRKQAFLPELNTT